MANSNSTLNQMYQQLLTSEGLKIRLVGHTDNTGNSNNNITLSLSRANAVKQYLVNKGLDPSRIEVDGKGDSEPIADNITSEGKAQNRRVEFILGN